jgi:hypothetical protein
MVGSSAQAHPVSLHWCHAQFNQLTGAWIQPWQVEQTKITSILLVSADAFVIIDKITAAVQDQLSVIYLERSRMV